MNETVFCRCSTCGYEWKRGQHGGHDCAQTLDAHYEAVSAQSSARIAELEEELETIKNYESPVKSYKIAAWQRDYVRQQLAAAQADNVRLRGALNDVQLELDPTEHGQDGCECDPSTGYQCPACRFYNSKVYRIIQKAINATAHPLDASALDAYVANFAVRTAQLEGQVAMLRAKLPVSVPQGWKVVPITPTGVMIDAGILAYRGKCEESYSAMLEAAPLPPAPGKQGE